VRPCTSARRAHPARQACLSEDNRIEAAQARFGDGKANRGIFQSDDEILPNFRALWLYTKWTSGLRPTADIPQIAKKVFQVIEFVLFVFISLL